MPDQVEVLALPGIPEVRAGTDLAAVLIAAVASAGRELVAGDVLVVSSKIVSKALGLVADASQRESVVAAQRVRVVAERRTPHGLSQVVQSAAGPVMAAAGVDGSNTAPGTVLILPADPDGQARDIRAALHRAGAPRVAVVVTDTAGRAWRRGQVDFALGCAGVIVVDDLRGTADASGQLLEVTERVVADEVAAAADLVKGKASGVPAALVRGLAGYVTDDDGPGAASLLRAAGSDWFRLGPVEAVRAALGVTSGSVQAPSVGPEPLRHRVFRAAQVAGGGELRDGSTPVAVEVEVRVVDAFERGRLVERLLVALWAEDLIGEVAPTGAAGQGDGRKPSQTQVAVVRVRPGPAGQY